MSLLSVMALLAGGPGWVLPASAEVPVVCGQTVTASITLSVDLGPCAGDGLVVGASGITVDLAGHTIRGTGAPATGPDQVGVRVADLTGVTVQGGTVRDFNAGVLLSGGSGHTVTRMVVTNNVGPGNSPHGDGILLDLSSNNTVMYNVVTNNGPEAGIELNNTSNNNHVAYNSVTDNNVVNPLGYGGGDQPRQLTSGISNDNGASFNVIDHNVASRNGLFGIALAGFQVGHGQALFNDVRENGGYGINAGGDGEHLISSNVIDHNGYEQFLPLGASGGEGGDGGVATCGRCFRPGDFTTIERNVVTNNTGNGIDLLYNGAQFLGGVGRFGPQPSKPYVAPRSNLVQGNVVRSNTGDGIFVECDMVFDANFNSICLSDTPPHQGIRVLKNNTAGNGARDLHDGNRDCDHNIWSGNSYQTFNPPCTTAP